jgi:uracil-DNA glycosylase
MEDFLSKERENFEIFPKECDIYKAIELCPFEKTKVVILGQDPYHGPDQANGLAFSVNEGISMPPSLKNIAKELKRDTGLELQNGDLSFLANKGVLLLNCVLTVRRGQPNSHANKGWEEITDTYIKKVQENEKVVFMLWGKYAQKKKILIDETKHSVLVAPHPSPLSAHRGFFGCGHFSKANLVLNEKMF